MKRSPRGYFSDTRKRFHATFYGQNFIDKIKLLFSAVLLSIPNSFVEKARVLEHAREYANKVAANVKIRVGETVFHLVDFESVIILSDSFEPWMWKHLQVSDGGTFVDVGAHVGKYTVQVAKHHPESMVIALEPNPENFRALEKNVKENRLSNVKLYNLAAWNRKCILKLYTGDKGGHHSVKREFGRGYDIVQATTLDDIVRDAGVERVDVVKVDVEGAEAEVVEGALEIIRRHHPKLVIEIFDSPEKILKLLPPEYSCEKVADAYYLFYANASSVRYNSPVL